MWLPIVCRQSTEKYIPNTHWGRFRSKMKSGLVSTATNHSTAFIFTKKLKKSKPSTDWFLQTIRPVLISNPQCVLFSSVFDHGGIFLSSKKQYALSLAFLRTLFCIPPINCNKNCAIFFFHYHLTNVAFFS